MSPRWWTRLLRRTRMESQLDAELRDHLDRHIADGVASGLDRAEATRQARLALGGLEPIKEACRDARGTRAIEDLIQDIRYAGRLSRRSPGFVAAAIASLALGIGANTAIFSLIDVVMLKALPVREPERLIEPLVRTSPGERPFNAFSGPAVAHFRENLTTLDGVMASGRWQFFVTMDGGPTEREHAEYVTGNYFDVLGVQPHVGRTLHPSDDRPADAFVVVLGHAHWLRRFGGDPQAIGRRLTIDDRVFTIVGVAPPAFRGTLVGRDPAFWIPLAAEPTLHQPSWLDRPTTKWLNVLARMKPGVGVNEARTELETLFRTAVVDAQIPFVKEDPQAVRHVRQWSLTVVPAHGGLSALRQEYETPLLVLLGVSGSVLLIACVNVANLLLVRAQARRHEIAVRLALGAARGRLIRQLLTESLLLSSAGAALGLALAYAGCRYLLDFFSSSRMQLTLAVDPDWRVLAFTGALAVATGILFGLAPAWRATIRGREAAVHRGARVLGSADRRTLSHWLIGGQVAVSLVMLVCAGLFLRSLHNLRTIDSGFESDAVLLVGTDASRSRLAAEAQRTAFRDSLAQLAALPGVQSVSLSEVTPIEGGGTMRHVSVHAEAGVREARDVHLNWIAPSFFATLRTPLLAGRDFTWQDTPTSPKVAIVNRTIARQHFRTEAGAIGKRITLDTATYEIVGVAGDAKYLELREATPPTLYFASFQRSTVGGTFSMRVSGSPSAIEHAARDVLRTVAPTLAVTGVRSLSQQIDASIVRERMLGALSGFFAMLGLLLAAVGLYGVMAYTVTQRTSEIAIRIALGAKPSRVAGMVLRQALVLTAAGIAIGVAVALVLSRGLASLLYDLAPNDPLTLVSAAAVMLLTAIVAAGLPSRRAARLDPTVALRHE